MTIFELLSLIVSFLALFISAFTAYKTSFVKFRGEISLKPRIILTSITGRQVIVIGCHLSNGGAKSGSIDDVILIVKYRQNSPRVVERYTFFPILTRDNYSIYEIYQDSDFEPFKSLGITAKSSMTKYIVFSPSNDNFSPSAGKAEIKLAFRKFDESKWLYSNNEANLRVQEIHINAWSDPEGNSIIIETEENYESRNRFMEKVFS